MGHKLRALLRCVDQLFDSDSDPVGHGTSRQVGLQVIEARRPLVRLRQRSRPPGDVQTTVAVPTTNSRSRNHGNPYQNDDWNTYRHDEKTLFHWVPVTYVTTLVSSISVFITKRSTKRPLPKCKGTNQRASTYPASSHLLNTSLRYNYRIGY
jgi:hypothetical protein